MAEVTYAFRCRACGQLVATGHAGELPVPGHCPVCRSGVSYDPKNGRPVYDPESWEVLAGADDARLAELGLTRAEVAAHDPAVHKAASDAADLANAHRILAELQAKEERWKSRPAEEWQADLDALLAERDAAHAATPPPVHVHLLFAAHETAKATAQQKIDDFLADVEWTDRDEAHRAEVLRGVQVHQSGGAARKPRALRATAADGTGVRGGGRVGG